MISADAGNLPAFKIFAKSFVSCTVKSPDILELPPAIGPVVTPGAEYTILSKTIAILDCWLNALPVKISQSLAPFAFICIETTGLFMLSKSARASVTTPPDKGATCCAFPFNAYNSVTFEFLFGLPQANFTCLKSPLKRARTCGSFK